MTELKLALSSNFCIFARMISPDQNAETNSGKNQIRHIVCLKFKNEASPIEVLEIEEKFPALQQSIPGIVSIEWGTNNSPEGLNKDFSHCFIVTFENEDARTTYLPHPLHQAFVNILKPLLDDVFVIDFSI